MRVLTIAVFSLAMGTQAIAETELDKFKRISTQEGFTVETLSKHSSLDPLTWYNADTYAFVEARRKIKDHEGVQMWQTMTYNRRTDDPKITYTFNYFYIGCQARRIKHISSLTYKDIRAKVGGKDITGSDLPSDMSKPFSFLEVWDIMQVWPIIDLNQRKIKYSEANDILDIYDQRYYNGIHKRLCG